MHEGADAAPGFLARPEPGEDLAVIPPRPLELRVTPDRPGAPPPWRSNDGRVEIEAGAQQVGARLDWSGASGSSSIVRSIAEQPGRRTRQTRLASASGVEAAGRGGDEDWQRWSSVHPCHAREREHSRLLPQPGDRAYAARSRKVSRLQQVELVGDEMANMVWGIETRIAPPVCVSKSGRSAAFDTARPSPPSRRGEHPAAPPPAPPIQNLRGDPLPTDDPGAGEPDPLHSVHIDNDTREIQLRRAAMLRTIDDDPDAPARIEPRTNLLRAGLDLDPLVHVISTRRRCPGPVSG